MESNFLSSFCRSKYCAGGKIKCLAGVRQHTSVARSERVVEPAFIAKQRIVPVERGRNSESYLETVNGHLGLTLGSIYVAKNKTGFVDRCLITAYVGCSFCGVELLVLVQQSGDEANGRPSFVDDAEGFRGADTNFWTLSFESREGLR